MPGRTSESSSSSKERTSESSTSSKDNGHYFPSLARISSTRLTFWSSDCALSVLDSSRQANVSLVRSLGPSKGQSLSAWRGHRHSPSAGAHRSLDSNRAHLMHHRVGLPDDLGDLVPAPFCIRHGRKRHLLVVFLFGQPSQMRYGRAKRNQKVVKARQEKKMMMTKEEREEKGYGTEELTDRRSCLQNAMCASGRSP